MIFLIFTAILLVQPILGLSYKVSIDTELIKSRGSASTFYPNSLDSSLVLDSKLDPSLKIKIRLEDKETLDLITAEQVFLTLEMKNSDERSSFVVPKKGSVYTFELSAKSLSPGSYSAILYVADEKLASLQYRFGSIEMFNDILPAAGAEDYFPKKVIVHKFRPDVQEPLAVIPNLFSALTLSPWGILYFLWSSQGVNLGNYTANPSLLILTTFFLIFLALSLNLYALFWIKLNIFQFFGYAIPLWTITAIFGRYALIQRALLRTEKQES